MPGITTHVMKPYVALSFSSDDVYMGQVEVVEIVDSTRE